MTKLADIAFLRDPGTRTAWSKIGSMFYDQEGDRCRIILYTFRQGLCYARPLGDNPPPISGDIMLDIGEHEGHKLRVQVGWITPVEHGAYSIHLEACPLTIAQKPAGVWLDVELDGV